MSSFQLCPTYDSKSRPNPKCNAHNLLTEALQLLKSYIFLYFSPLPSHFSFLLQFLGSIFLFYLFPYSLPLLLLLPLLPIPFLVPRNCYIIIYVCPYNRWRTRPDLDKDLTHIDTNIITLIRLSSFIHLNISIQHNTYTIHRGEYCN